MIKIQQGSGQVLGHPQVFYTLKGNPRSESVILTLRDTVAQEKKAWNVDCLVFSDGTEANQYFEGCGVPRDTGVVCFDEASNRHFSYVTRFRGDMLPEWARESLFGVKVGERTIDGRVLGCAQQVSASFIRHWEYLQTGIEKRRNGGVDTTPWFPWGAPRQKEAVPQSRTTELANKVLPMLNSGPNLAAIVSDLACAAELPAGSNISWFRVADAHIECNEASFAKRAVEALQAFEEVSAALVGWNTEVGKILLHGVDLHDPNLSRLYLNPSNTSFSVRRPDFHWAGKEISASENDEMPGGFAELVHVDHSYGVNQDRWEDCFKWLTEKGTLLFVVSHNWSKCYIPEMQWLTGYMRQKGYPVEIIQTDEMDEQLSVSDHGVFYRGEKVGTVWRQFPIFETEGKLVQLVEAAHRGLVRMVPEFAHFGNKAWFAIFRSHREFFEKQFETRGQQDLFALLDQFIPCSHLVLGKDSFPCEIEGYRIESLEDLRNLPSDTRDQLVLKIVGANNMASRSYGVLMGHNLKLNLWQEWIDERLRDEMPFIVQKRFSTAVETLPVLNTKNNAPEGFRCRLLIRPWVVGGKLISAHTCAVPSSTLRVHGRVDMAVAPIVWV